jgi:hypothetical protein
LLGKHNTRERQHNHEAVYAYKYMEEVVKKNNMGSHFLWCADIQENLAGPLYVDEVHYSPKMSKILADYIANLLLERHLLRVRPLPVRFSEL